MSVSDPAKKKSSLELDDPDLNLFGYDYVHYSTDATGLLKRLIKDTPIRGKEHTDYQVRFELTANFLKLKKPWF